MNSSILIDTAAGELTKPAVVVSIVFIFAIGVEVWLYILGRANLIEYQYDSNIYP